VCLWSEVAPISEGRPSSLREYTHRLLVETALYRSLEFCYKKRMERREAREKVRGRLALGKGKWVMLEA
jgi:hypothetical protein